MAEGDKMDGYEEFCISGNCDFDLFYEAATKLQNQFDAVFADKIDDFDTLYWPFHCQDSSLILYYNIYSGLSIYPKNVDRATETENNLVKIIATRW